MTLCEANRDDDGSSAELFCAVFQFARRGAHYRWKFIDNPDGPPVIALVDDADRLTGLCRQFFAHIYSFVLPVRNRMRTTLSGQP